MNSAIMFVSHKSSPSKKTFQKPNILRRKPKVPSIRAPCKPSPAPPTAAPLTKPKPLELASKHVEEVANPQAIQRVTLEVAQDEAETPNSPNTHPAAVDSVTDAPDVKTVAQESVLVDEAAAGAEQEHELIDVEAFLTGGRSTQYKAQYEVHTNLENSSLQKRHIDFENAADRIIMEPYGRLAAPGVDAPRDSRSGAGAELAVFKCSELSCGKAFATEQKLRRHRVVHDTRRAARAQPVECPARGGGGAGGAAGQCARVFLARDLLAKHLRDDHHPEDAPHRCGECGRRFFWAVGLRAHVRAHGARARGALHACAWPGCARVFRQPCRLREHARAHTGDRPYRCTHPGCAWAFRTASKLLRHARKHTGERRHRCACGRAFRRREHLRDHQARHTHTRPAECGAAPAPSGEVAGGHDDTYTVRLAGAESQDAAGGGVEHAGRGAEARAARTHCTWPLEPHAPDTLAEERSCAVRSDLFLAAAGGDDSQQLMAGAGACAGDEGAVCASAGDGGAICAGAGGAGAEAVLEAASPLPPLGLLDLMQEELLYPDAVDESSFQVLLLSEELG